VGDGTNCPTRAGDFKVVLPNTSPGTSPEFIQETERTQLSPSFIHSAGWVYAVEVGSYTLRGSYEISVFVKLWLKKHPSKTWDLPQAKELL